MTLNSIKSDQQLGIQYITNESRDFSLKSKMVSNNHSSAQTPPSMFTIHWCWISNACKSILFSAYNSTRMKFREIWSWLLSMSQNTNHIAIICSFMSVKSKCDVPIGIQRVIAICKNRERVNQLVKKQNKWSNKKKSICINDGW